jgi:protein TonB
MKSRTLVYASSFLAATAVHAGIFFGLGNAFHSGAQYAVSAGSTVDLILVESAGEPGPPAEEEIFEEPVVEPEEPEEPMPEPEPTPEPLPEPEPTPEEISLPEAPTSLETQPEPAATPAPPVSTPKPARPTTASRPQKPVGTGPKGSATGGPGTLVRASPNYLRNPPPAYPAESKRAGEEGVVLLAVHVDQQGRPASVRVRRSSGFSRLDRAAVTAVHRWRFKPAKVAGMPVASEVEVPVRFQLR